MQKLELDKRDVLFSLLGMKAEIYKNIGLPDSAIAAWESMRLYAINTNDTILQADADMRASESLSQIISLKNSPTSISENALADEVQVYPNPAKDVLNITLTGFNPASSELSGLEGTLTSAEGRLVKTFDLTEKSTQDDISGLQPGLYVIKIESAKSMVLKRVVIQ